MCKECPEDFEHKENGECCGMCEKVVEICDICPKGMMIINDNSTCGSCVNDPEDCSNI
jgi:hypothetical protein